MPHFSSNDGVDLITGQKVWVLIKEPIKDENVQGGVSYHYKLVYRTIKATSIHYVAFEEGDDSEFSGDHVFRTAREVFIDYHLALMKLMKLNRDYLKENWKGWSTKIAARKPIRLNPNATTDDLRHVTNTLHQRIQKLEAWAQLYEPEEQQKVKQ